MAWTIRIERDFERDLQKLDRSVRRRIVAYLEDRIATAHHPKDFGKSLSHELAEYWRYRVGDYRILCRIEEDILTVVAVGVGHRSTVYD